VTTLRLLCAFFLVVPPVTRPIRGCLWLTAAAGAALVVSGVVNAVTALTPLLVLQIFASSSGFGAAARRGHYDLLLSRGVGVTSVLTAHWTASIAPGLGAWLVVAMAEKVTSGAASAAASSGSLLAFVLASSIPWALTAPWPRFAAAMGWLVLLVTSLAVVPSGQLELVAAARAPEPSLLGTLALVAYPMALLGFDGARLPAATLGAAFACATATVATTLWWYRRSEWPLESAA
jgi:hypothetical protein